MCYLRLTLLLFISSLNSIAQSGSFDRAYHEGDYVQTRFAQSVDLFYGQKIFHFDVLNESVNNLSTIKFGEPLSYVGMSVTSTLTWNDRYSYPGSVSFYHVVPQKIMIEDSISGRISGFDFRLPLAGFDVWGDKKWIDLILGTGLNMGRIRLFGDSRLEQVNAYFAPYASFTQRFNIKRVSIQFRAEYELDITRSRWRKVWFSTSPKVDLGLMRSTGLNASVSIGWVFL